MRSATSQTGGPSITTASAGETRPPSGVSSTGTKPLPPARRARRRTPRGSTANGASSEGWRFSPGASSKRSRGWRVRRNSARASALGEERVPNASWTASSRSSCAVDVVPVVGRRLVHHAEDGLGVADHAAQPGCVEVERRRDRAGRADREHRPDRARAAPASRRASPRESTTGRARRRPRRHRERRVLGGADRLQRRHDVLAHAARAAGADRAQRLRTRARRPLDRGLDRDPVLDRRLDAGRLDRAQTRRARRRRGRVRSASGHERTRFRSAPVDATATERKGSTRLPFVMSPPVSRRALTVRTGVHRA